MLCRTVPCRAAPRYAFGLRATTATNASIFETFTPINTTLIALVLGSESFGRGRVFLGKIGGVSLSVFGAIIVIAASHRAKAHMASKHSRHLWGNVVMFLSTVVLAIYMILQKPLSAK